MRVEDMNRFVARGRYRGGYPVREQEGSERFWCLGSVYVRIYDQTTEIRRRGLSWLPDLWGDREADEPDWRVEAEVRRQGLVDLQLPAVDDVLAGLQDDVPRSRLSCLDERPGDDRVLSNHPGQFSQGCPIALCPPNVHDEYGWSHVVMGRGADGWDSTSTTAFGAYE